jgi:adenylate cyclase
MHARLTDNLVRRGASVIVFDLDFSEPRDDNDLAVAIARAQRVVLFERIDAERLSIEHGPGGISDKIIRERIVHPAKRLQLAAIGLGPFPLPKVPARVDQFWAFKTVADSAWPTLPAVALQVHALPSLGRFLALLERAGLQRLDRLPQGRADVRHGKDLRRLMRNLRVQIRRQPEISERFLRALATDEDLSADKRRILTALVKLYGGDDDYHINYYGPPGAIRTIPYYAVLNDDAPFDGKHELDLSGKVVFVGVSEFSSADQKDGFHTVFSSEYGVDLSGVEIAASAFGNLLTADTLRRLSNLTTVTIVLVFGGLVGGLATLLPGVRGVASTVAVGGIYFGSGQFLFTEHNLVVPLVVPLLLQLPLALITGLFSQYRSTTHELENVGRAIQAYIPKEVAESLVSSGELTLNPDLVYGTCLSTDVEHYTTLSEKLFPQDLVSLMNEYFTLLVDVIVRHQGTVSKIGDDSMMCVWATPQPEKDARLNACLAALEIRQSVDRFNDRHEDQMLPTRVGLHAGEVAIGNVGGGGHYAWCLTGDTANTTSRIEGLNKHLGTTILASESVVSYLDSLLSRRIGFFLLEGKSNPISIFEIVGQREGAGRAKVDLCERFASAISDFEAGRWSQAAQKFDAVLSADPTDGPARFLLERCRHFSKEPPPPGAGPIIHMQSK